MVIDITQCVESGEYVCFDTTLKAVEMVAAATLDDWTGGMKIEKISCM